MATIAGEAESDVGTGAHRMRLWGVAMEIFWANPLFGVGLNNYPFTVGDYMPAELLEKEGRSYGGQAAHSLYFTILSETGVVGSVLVGAIAYFSIRDVRTVLRRTRKAEKSVDAKSHGDLLEIRGMAYGLCGGMVGFGVAGVFLTAFAYPHFWYVVALVVSLVKLTERLNTRSTDGKLATTL
jgi:O-antigen ligase